MENEYTEYSIKDLIALLLGKIWLIIAVTICGGILAFCVSKFVMPLEYSSHISMYVQSYTGISENADNYQNNISNSKQLINTYIEVLKDDAVMRAVADKLEEEFDEQTLQLDFTLKDGNITPSSLRSCISITSVTDTSALTVTTTTKNPEVAAAICNDLSSVAQQFIQDAVGVGSISTIDTAKVYESPVAPNIRKNTLMGMMAAFVLIILIIFLIDFFDNTIKDTGVLATKYKKPIIGEIQQFGNEKKKTGEKYSRLTDETLPFNVVESYKSIRTNIAFSLSTFDKKIFAVSSSNPGEGKSTTAANVAIAAAQGGNKVLLIDADMRKSVQHKIFGLKNKKGLSTAISKMSKVEECIQKQVMENLDVMTAGPIPPNPSELLASDQMALILSQLAEEYSMIIIDTPPVNVVTDAMELANSISGIIMVLHYGRTTEDDTEAAMKKIEFAKINMLGFILNDVKVKHRSGYYAKYKYQYSYQYGYGYSSKQDETKENA